MDLQIFSVSAVYPFDAVPLEGHSCEKKSTLDHYGEIADDHTLVAMEL
jgi:hypothetical protein